MFKFLSDIKELQRDVKEIFDELNNDYAMTGWFSKRRTLQKRVSDLEQIVDGLLGHLKLEANQVAETPDQVIEGTPEHWEIATKGTWDKKQKENALKEFSGDIIEVEVVKKGRKSTKKSSK